MAKDPAFLFYSADFLVGTMGMTDSEVGIYIRLLCLQHQQGPMKLKLMERVCPGINDAILEKFTRQPDGTYANDRLLEETEKRKKHSDHQRENVKKRWGKNSDTMVIPEEYQTDTEPLPSLYQTDTKPLPNQYGGITTVIPLENEDENEIVIETEIPPRAQAQAGAHVHTHARTRTRTREEKPKKEPLLVAPGMFEHWDRYLTYRKEQHNFKYKSRDSEITAYNGLMKMAGGSPDIAAKIINQTIEKSWTGLFELKNNQNGKINQGGHREPPHYTGPIAAASYGEL